MKSESDEQYFSQSALSASWLKELRKSPAHLWAKYINPEREPEKPSPAMELGTAIHCAILEPVEFQKRYVEMPAGIDRRTKAGKEFWLEFEDANAGKTVLSADDMAIVTKVAKSVNNHVAAYRLIAMAYRIEEPTYWNEGAVNCKMKADVEIDPCSMFPLGLIADVKTTKDASPAGFAREAFNYGYHIQAAWYARGFMARNETKLAPPFIFIAVEKTEPFACTVQMAGEDFIELGWKECKRLMPIYARCMETGEWPSYTNEIVKLHLPAWAEANTNPEMETV